MQLVVTERFARRSIDVIQFRQHVAGGIVGRLGHGRVARNCPRAVALLRERQVRPDRLSIAIPIRRKSGVQRILVAIVRMLKKA